VTTSFGRWPCVGAVVSRQQAALVIGDCDLSVLIIGSGPTTTRAYTDEPGAKTTFRKQPRAPRVNPTNLGAVSMVLTVLLLAGTGASAQTGQPPTTTPSSSVDGPAPAQDIHLSCHGVANFVEGSSGSAFAFNNGGGSANAFGYETHRGSAEEDAFVEIAGGDAKIKLPGIMIPPLRSGDIKGWRPISKLEMGETEITGSVELNFINKLNLSINRATGHIDLRGLGRTGFSGDCRPYDPSARMF
jgi:hypothetical protein